MLKLTKSLCNYRLSFCKRFFPQRKICVCYFFKFKSHFLLGRVGMKTYDLIAQKLIILVLFNWSGRAPCLCFNQRIHSCSQAQYFDKFTT